MLITSATDLLYNPCSPFSFPLSPLYIFSGVEAVLFFPVFQTPISTPQLILHTTKFTFTKYYYPL